MKRPARLSMPFLIGPIGVVLACFATVGVAPSASADPQVPCAALDQIRGSLADDISAGIDGVRTVITSPYLVGSVQKRDAETRLAMVSHGVTVMRGVNANGVVPGLAQQLDQLDRANGDMREAVEALFQLSGGYNYGASYSNAWPQPSTWTAIDYTDQKKNDIYALVNSVQGSCVP